MRKVSGDSEYLIHSQIIRWLMVKATQCPWAEEFFHVPNGGHRSIREGVRMKNLGVKAGIFDLLHPAKVAIEVKRPGGRLSKEQKEWKARFESYGWRCEVVESLEEFVGLVEKIFSV